MNNRRAVGLLNPMRDIKIEGKNRGGEGMTPVTTACPEAGKSKSVLKKKQKRVKPPSSPRAMRTYRRPAYARRVDISDGLGNIC